MTGLGDLIAALLKITRLDYGAKLYTRITGKPCNCEARKQWLNKRFPIRPYGPRP
jgi:hypothetical protein